MNKYSDGYAGAQIDRGGCDNAGIGAGDEPTAVELANAKERVNADFDRLSKSIAASAELNAEFDAHEITLLLKVLEEKRAEELTAAISLNWIRSWQANGRARSILLKDTRAALVYKARDERRRVAAEHPVRYFGFTDEKGFRVFRFGRLPETESSTKYRVCVSLAFFSRNRMALQEGPGFCAALLSRRGEPDDCVASIEDLENFLANRSAQAVNKSRERQRTQTPHDGK